MKDIFVEQFFVWRMFGKSFHFVDQNNDTTRQLKHYLKAVCLINVVKQVHPFLNVSSNMIYTNELYKKQLRINNTVVNKKIQKVLDSWMIWDCLLFVDKNRNYLKFQRLTISARLSPSTHQIPLCTQIQKSTYHKQYCNQQKKLKSFGFLNTLGIPQLCSSK